MAFQREGVRFALCHGGRALIGDEMGLGKTVQVRPGVKPVSPQTPVKITFHAYVYCVATVIIETGLACGMPLLGGAWLRLLLDAALHMRPPAGGHEAPEDHIIQE